MGCQESKTINDKYSKAHPVNIQQVLNPFPNEPSNRHNRRRRTSSVKSKSRNVSPRKTTSRTLRSKESILIDSRINTKYKIKAVIGKGSFSRVVRVEDRLTHQPYAIKLIESAEGKDIFEAELTVLRRVNHPNVIQLIEVFESEHKVFMVMELATGGSLLDRLETHGYYNELEAQKVLRMVLSGIGYLHSLGITHRDLKPDNLLYYHPGNDSKLLITDFGFASTRKSNGHPYMHTVCGTPQYIAPEIVARRPYTSSVDIWAIGVITYIVLSGTFPFDSKQDSLIFKQILKGKFSFSGMVWEGISEYAKDFIQCLLTTKPELRLSAADAAKHHWVQTAFPNSTNLFASPSRHSGLRRTGSQRSSLSAGSSRSCRSLRSEHHRVHSHQLEALHSDPEISAMVSS